MAKLSFGYLCKSSRELDNIWLGKLTLSCRIKVASLTVFFILAIVISSGGIGPQKIGFKYWSDPGAFADSINGVAKTFVIAGTLYAGTEM